MKHKCLATIGNSLPIVSNFCISEWYWSTCITIPFFFPLLFFFPLWVSTSDPLSLIYFPLLEVPKLVEPLHLLIFKALWTTQLCLNKRILSYTIGEQDSTKGAKIDILQEMSKQHWSLNFLAYLQHMNKITQVSYWSTIKVGNSYLDFQN